MSHIQNEQWVEAAHENFQDAVSMGDLKLAKDIIQDTLDAGFREEAEKMNETLRELPIAQTKEKEHDFDL